MEKSTHTRDYRALRAKLHSVRQNAGLSQRDLATRLGVPHSWVAKVESGERRIDLIEFCWFASACGVDPLPIFEDLLRKTKTLRTARPVKEAREESRRQSATRPAT